MDIGMVANGMHCKLKQQRWQKVSNPQESVTTNMQCFTLRVTGKYYRMIKLLSIIS